LFSRKIDDATKLKFTDIIAGMLKIQTFVAGSASIEDEQGYPKRKVSTWTLLSKMSPAMR
jgi:hypothetical protein